MPYRGISEVRSPQSGGRGICKGPTILFVVLDSQLKAINFKENFVKKLLKKYDNNNYMTETTNKFSQISPLSHHLFLFCFQFALILPPTEKKKTRVRKFWAPILRKFLDTSLEIMQLMRKVSRPNRIEKARNCPNACRYQRAPPGGNFFGGRGNSLHTALVVGVLGRGQK